MIYRVRCEAREVCSRCQFETALGFRMKGLLGRSGLAGHEGILLKPCNSIHMFFMGFPIDAIFLDKENRILKIYHAIKPWRISGLHFKACSVLEVAAGVAEQAGLRIGEVLVFEERGQKR